MHVISRSRSLSLSVSLSFLHRNRSFHAKISPFFKLGNSGNEEKGTNENFLYFSRQSEISRRNGKIFLRCPIRHIPSSSPVPAQLLPSFCPAHALAPLLLCSNPAPALLVLPTQ